MILRGNRGSTKNKRSDLHFLLINLEGTTLLSIAAYFVYTKLPYYIGLLGTTAITILTYFFFIYLALNIAYFLYCYIKKISLEDTKITILYNSLAGILTRNKQKVDNKKLKTAILSTIVKFFFFPIMFATVVNRWPIVFAGVQNLFAGGFSIFTNFNYLFNFLLAAIFFFDTLVFAFGYAFEAKELRSEIRSVEPTFFGWAVALATYPPFNDHTSQFLDGLAKMFLTNSQTFSVLIPASAITQSVATALRLLTLILYSIYLWATFALGTKSSNLTNRGIVSSGPYKFLRHPAYISKNLAWWIESILSGLNVARVIVLVGWNMIYFFRAKTEENHLSLDPDYVKYKKKVKWKFIPGLF